MLSSTEVWKEDTYVQEIFRLDKTMENKVIGDSRWIWKLANNHLALESEELWASVTAVSSTYIFISTTKTFFSVSFLDNIYFVHCGRNFKD